jgi:Spy/CpxP family protein refolding chaperone
MLLRLGHAAISSDHWATQLIEQYQITNQQVNQLIVIENRYSDQIDQLSQQLKLAEKELTKLMVNSAESTPIIERERQFEALQLQAAQLYFDKFLAIREVLTLAQRLELYPTRLDDRLDH